MTNVAVGFAGGVVARNDAEVDAGFVGEINQSVKVNDGDDDSFKNEVDFAADEVLIGAKRVARNGADKVVTTAEDVA